MQSHNKNTKQSNYSLLTNSEFQLLNGKGDRSISKNFEYKMRSNIKKKVRIFLEKELPLLLENHLISFGYDNYNIDPNIVENIKKDNDLVRKRSRDRIPLKTQPLSINFGIFENSIIKL
ncbi:MAG TPA: hypothetical protein VJ767_02865 [Nitrososphaeraceae archaeon]|nr:hypothetical protein [Nitrososphaeraceae archaeon]